MSPNFQRDGYQIFRQVVPSNIIERLRTYLERSVASLTEATEATAIGLLPLKNRREPILWELAKAESVQNILKEILDAKSLCLSLAPTARFVPPGDRRPMVPAHQDSSYVTHLSNFVTVWVPLVEIDEKCGGVSVFKNSPAEVLPTRAVGNWHEALETNPSLKVDCAPMSPGDILIFNKFMIHQSMPNLSDRTRYSIDYRFFSSSIPSTRSYLSIDDWMIYDEICHPETKEMFLVEFEFDQYMNYIAGRPAEARPVKQ
jgi:hypothetical protein